MTSALPDPATLYRAFAEYDGSFEGLLTAIFEVYEYKFNDAEIIKKDNYVHGNFFGEVHEVFLMKKNLAFFLKDSMSVLLRPMALNVNY